MQSHPRSTAAAELSVQRALRLMDTLHPHLAPLGDDVRATARPFRVSLSRDVRSVTRWRVVVSSQSTHRGRVTFAPIRTMGMPGYGSRVTLRCVPIRETVVYSVAKRKVSVSTRTHSHAALVVSLSIY
jgi:hypothetical protein